MNKVIEAGHPENESGAGAPGTITVYRTTSLLAAAEELFDYFSHRWGQEAPVDQIEARVVANQLWQRLRNSAP
jgi:hypothetical protein